jgi:cleavage and polyadenylation specificity factor subunit 1
VYYIELTKSENKKWCLTIIDKYTKWVEVFPTSSADAETVARALCQEIIPRFGLPEVIEHIGQKLDINMKKHSSYHPQSAGLIENMNRSVKG